MKHASMYEMNVKKNVNPITSNNENTKKTKELIVLNTHCNGDK